MDCERINTLLTKYWGCETTIEEERELRCFFVNGKVPYELRPYSAWFVTSEAEQLPLLGSDFDRKILEQIDSIKRIRRLKWIYSVTFFIVLVCLVLFFLMLTSSFMLVNDAM